ncbi:LprI domain-containing protein [Pseudomonas sp. IT-232MI5]|uniref:lysozyme inhibitor LprI family protein n=1 Tax=Pseudomonas sp. IT-232MI5 TaxID=3026442 RepID=UPI0039E18922
MFAISLRYALLLTSLAFASVTHASSFDCSTANNKTEKAVCGDPQISLLDEKLGKLWHSTLASVPDAKALKADQRQWLKSRNACGDQTACLRREYLMRLSELEHATQPFSWDATWQLIPPGTSTSATVITQRRDATHISIDITAAEGANSGDLDGVATLNDGKADYSEDECTLLFTPINGVLDISLAGEGGYCSAGLGVYYTGRFVASEHPLTLDYDMLSLGLAQTPEENQALHTLLKGDYQTLVEKSGSLMTGEPGTDVPGSQVWEMWMRGLGGTGIVMRSSDGHFWVLLVTYDSSGHSRLRYYTNVAKWKKVLPDALHDWNERMKAHLELPVDFMP